MINPRFLPQNAKKRKKQSLEDSSINFNATRKQFKLIHQLDCIYQGQINASYQKQGFGIQQTNDFYMYLGFWKVNKANGLGMIIYPQGGIIYGNFKDNQLYGVALVDNKKRLRIGMFEKYQILGIGFEYIYAQSKWKLSRFHKGIAIETLSETISPIDNGPPSLMNLHEDMNILLTKYLNQQYFDVNSKSLIQRPYRSYTDINVHKIGNAYLYFGQVIQGKYWGLGLIYDKKNGYSLQTGYYEMGQINGYGLKIDKDKNKLQIGHYSKGKKQGFFYEKTNYIEIIVEYQRNYVKGEHPEMNRQKIKNNQKIFNYQKNDFYSQKNKVDFKGLKIHFDVDQKQVSKLNQTLKSSITLGNKKTDKQPAKKAHSPPHGHIQKKGVKYMTPEMNVQKSTVQFIRQKLGDIDNIIKRSRAMVKDDKQKKQPVKKGQYLQVDTIEQDEQTTQVLEDQQIYEQQKPVCKDYDLSDFYKQNKNRRVSPRALTPRSIKKIWQHSKSPINNTTGKKRDSPRMMQQRQNPKQVSFFLATPPTNNFNLSPARNQRSVSQRKKRRIFQ